MVDAALSFSGFIVSDFLVSCAIGCFLGQSQALVVPLSDGTIKRLGSGFGTGVLGYWVEVPKKMSSISPKL